MSEWQPIKTAPKDGTEIQLWAVLTSNKKGQWWPKCYWGGNFGIDWWMAIDEEGEGVLEKSAWKPTHWMPEPEPPK